MFPSINTQKWLELSHDRVLVGIGLDRDPSRLSVLDQPGPA